MRSIVAAAILACPLAARAAAPAAMAYYTGPDSRASLREEADVLRIVPADLFNVDATGRVSGHAPPDLFSFAGAHGIALLATVSNYGTHGFDRAAGHAVLTESAAARRAIDGMVRVAGSGFAGVNLDFENVAPTDRAAYTDFAAKLAAALHAAHATLTLSVPAKTGDDPHDGWSGAYDFARLGAVADTLQVMTYDEHTPGGRPGPVAGLDWVRACIGYAESVVPPAKVSEGLPAYGYDWLAGTTQGRTVNWKDIPALLASTGATPRWDDAAASPWFTYADGKGQKHVVWYENARSIRLKSRLARAARVASVSVWALGLDDRAFWEAVRAGLAGGGR